MSISISKNNGSVGRFVISAASIKEARTYGVCLRKFLLDEMPGYAATAVMIEGISHEFQTIPGVREDVLSLISNIKHIRITGSTDKLESSLNIGGDKITAGQLEIQEGKVVNRELVLAHTMPGTNIKARIIFEKGKGYVSAGSAPDGYIPIDADFSPVRRVAINFTEDMLDITIETDAGIAPASALVEAMQAVGEVRDFKSVDPVINNLPFLPDKTASELVKDPFCGFKPISSLDLVQESYEQFLEQGIQELLERLFPLISHAFGEADNPEEKTRSRRIDLLDWKLIKSDVTPEKCLQEGLTYEAHLSVRTRLRRTSRDGIYNIDHPSAIEEREIDLGALPLMTLEGCFIMNGARRVCVMQTDDGLRVQRIADLLMAELTSLIDKMKPVLEDRLSVSDWLHNEILKILPLTATINDLLTSSDWSQYMDQTNPLAGYTHKMRVVHKGVRDLRSVPDPVRFVRNDHWGRIGYLETPEGPNIGLIHTLCPYTKIDENGELLTPYRPVNDGKVSDEVVYLTPSEEANYRIADSSAVEHDNRLIKSDVLVRVGDDIKRVPSESVQMVALSPIQPLSMSSALIPLIEHDDANRTLMASNMMRQASPLVESDQPLVKSGLEADAARDTGILITARHAGKVVEVTSRSIAIVSEGGTDKYELINFQRTNQATCLNYKPTVNPGQSVTEGQVIAEPNGIKDGELALGRNVLVAYMPFRGYNFEDAICISDELVRTDAFNSIFLERYGVDVGEKDVWLAPIGTRVNRGDVLVQEQSGKNRPLLVTENYSVNTVVESTIKNGKAYIMLAENRNINVGDKFAGRHGNKGVIAKVMPRSQMPHLEDGTPIQMLLNPLGVISRMNLGQILETHYGVIAALTGRQFVIPPFMSPSNDLLKRALKEAGLPEGGMVTLFDGVTGKPFEMPVTVGYLYMMKLNHLVEDKIHAVATGAPSFLTQQPRYGGQRLGFLEMWALEAYGAGYTLQESLTIKSDDSEGRERTALALLDGKDIDPAGEGQSLHLLESALRSVGFIVEEER